MKESSKTLQYSLQPKQYAVFLQLLDLCNSLVITGKRSYPSWNLAKKNGIGGCQVEQIAPLTSINVSVYCKGLHLFSLNGNFVLMVVLECWPNA